MLLHPTTGPESSEEWQTFAGQPLRLQSVRVVKSSWVRVETLQG
jgi:hypothetical protein